MAVSPGPSPRLSSIYWARTALSLALGSALIIPNVYQPLLNHIYAHLLTSSIYQSSTFETFWTVFVYAVIESS